jgi:hypothetical protein
VLTIEDLKTKSGCHPRTLQRKIKSSHLLVSYNQNAKFYTTSNFAHFNHYGIWNYKQILFSKHGNLFETIIALINKCLSGYTAKELSVIIEVKADDALRILWLKQRINRQKSGSQNVYYSMQEELFAQQLAAREQQTLIAEPALILSDYQRIIAILVEIIQQDSLDAQTLLKGIRKRNIEITQIEIEAVIEHHELKKKKNKS